MDRILRIYIPRGASVCGLITAILVFSIFCGCGGGSAHSDVSFGTSPSGSSSSVATIGLTTITPSSGPTTGGTSVTITGTNFPTGSALTVTFGGTAATSVVINDSTTATVTTPVHAAGAVDVNVSLSSGGTATLTSGFTFFTPGAPLTITTTSLPAVLHGTSYSQQIQVVGGASIGQSFSITSGTLPAGLTMSPTTGLISGTPTSPGASIFTVSVTDSTGTTSKSLSINVLNTLAITTPSPLPDAIVNGTYSQQLTIAANSSASQQTWAITSGALPAGLTLSATTGLISGVPTVTGPSAFTVTVMDALQTASASFTMSVNNPLVIPGAIQNQAYSFTPPAIAGAGATWTGSVPAGLSVNASDGTISGTPTSFGTFNVTLTAASGSTTNSVTGFMIISAAIPVVGNTGNAYADEGGTVDALATPISACGHLAAHKSYVLTTNISGGTFGPGGCIILDGPGVKFDLQGFTVNGPIYINADASGTVIFNGTVTCNNDDTNGGNTGCVNLLSSNVPTAQMRVHHLTVHNSGGSGATAGAGCPATPSGCGARSIHIDWEAPSGPPTVAIRVYNITSTVSNQPNVVRSHNINVTGPHLIVEEAYNDLTCNVDAEACQGQVCFGEASCYQHGNKITMPFNTTGETARGLVFDEVSGGEIWNNTVATQNNRGVRIRDSAFAHIHDNVFNNIQTSSVATAAIHLADPDFGTDDLNAVIERNTFQIDDGKGIFIRNGIDTNVLNNTITCVNTCSGLFGVARQPIASACPAGTVRPGVICDGSTYETIISFNSNPTATVLPSPQIRVEVGAVANVCKSGTAAALGVPGGTINNSSSCP